MSLDFVAEGIVRDDSGHLWRDPCPDCGHPLLSHDRVLNPIAKDRFVHVCREGGCGCTSDLSTSEQAQREERTAHLSKPADAPDDLDPSEWAPSRPEGATEATEPVTPATATFGGGR